jgi:hypothetical protein
MRLKGSPTQRHSFPHAALRMPLTQSCQPVYLVELFSIREGHLECADICASLALALEQVYWHLVTFEDEPVRVTASDDEKGRLAGISFLRKDETLLGSVTAYRLDKERGDEASRVEELHRIAALPRADLMQDALSRIF